MEHFINILIADDNLINQRGLKEILNGGGNNVLLANSTFEAFQIVHQKEIGIIIVNIDKPDFGGVKFLSEIKKDDRFRNVYKVVLTQNTNATNHIVTGLNEGAIDFLTLPFNPNLVKAKIEIYKSLYYKDLRIRQLLSNIFPEKVLEDLNTVGKFSPKRIENGVVLFTDFVNFSNKAKSINPMKLLKKLESYFTKFDEITNRYKLEKIKTIGDSYMAIAGVTETLNFPEIRACLAALEMRDFMHNERDVAKALQKDYWEIRIGIHAGPLVAGVIGSKKYSFDVWGDTVNIASRAEQSAKSDSIYITKNVSDKVNNYFDLSNAGQVEIKKRGGLIEMDQLNRLKLEHCLYGEGKIANTDLLKKCELPGTDFDHMRKDILNRLKSLLPEDLVYHDINHTTNVEKAAIRFAKLEGISEHEIMLLRTAVYYHDAGFLAQYDHNEDYAIKMAQNLLPYFGYDEHELKTVTDIIEATKSANKPKNLLEKIMCDADHDYLGRADYYHVAKKLREEMENYNIFMTEIEWIEFQLNFLENKHEYYTDTAKNIRQGGKKARILELNKLRKEILENNTN
ncbi:MAG: adenylate/guanylate cyclase domain-containing protein [Flavobacteriia bacterium]|jgi:adenylate cyclase